MNPQNASDNRQSHPPSAEIDAALARLQRDPSLVLRLFPADWRTVDLARQRAAAAGLSDRISIHHRLALGVLARRAS